MDKPNSKPNPDTIRELTRNVRGINDHRKVRKILSYLRRYGMNVALLQETHLPLDSPILRYRGFQGNIHAAGFTTHARGVLTWVNPSSSLILEPLVTDQDGRYTITKCKGKGLDLLIVNIYGPNYNNPDFFKQWADKVDLQEGGYILCGGDFNLIRDPALDRSGGPERRITAAARTLEGVLVRFDLRDTWRQCHPAQGGIHPLFCISQHTHPY